MKLHFTFLAMCVVIIAAGCQKKDGGAANDAMKMKADSMKAAYTAMSAAWDAGKADEMDKYMTADVKENDMMMPNQKPGIAGIKEMVTSLKASFPDMKSTVDWMGVDGDMLTASFHVTATNSGPMMGMPATNKKMTGVHGIDILKWQNGKFVEHWGVFDGMGMMMQLGMMPMPGATPAGGDMGKPGEMKDMGGDKKKM
jgi:predicted ester cyclase